MSRRLNECALIVSLSLFLATALHADEPQLCGRLVEYQGLRVLCLWGSPEQAGYAHGYLLAEEIKGGVEMVTLSGFAGGSAERYSEHILPRMKESMTFAPEARAELEGMCRGMLDRLGPEWSRIAGLDRPLSVEDLMVMNCIADWVPFFCSSFSVWGKLTEGGQTLTARNLDYNLHESAIGGHLVIVYAQPDPNRARWVSLAWSGLIGCYTGMNEFGVTMSMHDVTPLHTPERKGLTPRSLVLREALEEAKPPGAFQTVGDVFRRHLVMFGNNIHVSVPVDQETPPALIFEYDGQQEKDGGVTVRAPRDTAVYVACTNHYRDRRKPLRCDRYSTIRKALRTAKKEKRTIDVESARTILRQVGRASTLQSVVFLPAEGEMHVSFISHEGNAAENPPTVLVMDELLSLAPEGLAARTP